MIFELLIFYNVLFCFLHTILWFGSSFFTTLALTLSSAGQRGLAVLGEDLNHTPNLGSGAVQGKNQSLYDGLLETEHPISNGWKVINSQEGRDDIHNHLLMMLYMYTKLRPSPWGLTVSTPKILTSSELNPFPMVWTKTLTWFGTGTGLRPEARRGHSVAVLRPYAPHTLAILSARWLQSLTRS